MTLGTGVFGAQARADDAPSRTEAESRLKAASAHRREANGLEGDERYSILDAAARDYESVANTCAPHDAVVAEAWFRAGEIHRTLRRVEEAQRCFQLGAAQEKCPEFAARSVLELGHLDRRLEEFETALELYTSVEERFGTLPDRAAEACTWAGKVLLAMGRTDEGHARLLSVRAKYPQEPLDDIRNVDFVALQWIGADRVEEARRLVEDCVALHSAFVPSEEAASKKRARDIETALSRMKSRARLNGN